MSQPAPAAGAGQESVLGRYAPESVFLLGAGRAILLQLALAPVGHGVARHSNFATNPVGRLHGTLTYIYALSNGTAEQRAKVRDMVTAVHAPVRSPAAADGSHPAYSARDPRLQLWVAATLYDSAMQIHELVLPPMDAETAEQHYREYAVLGTELGMPEGFWPANRADFAEYWKRTCAQLEVDQPVREVALELLAARNAPMWVRAVMPLARFMTIGLLPDSVRNMYGFSWTEHQQRRMGFVLRCARVAVRILPRRVRHFPMRYYLRRLDANGRTSIVT
ncbi:oxygenase MpaB family protein [Paeniglutamicibacter sp. NPDC012692]|uniref:oxygenase MpaB family protein n=1 Tax=Paeniglutamicibacter sp. NPDC012692 TaxID=3364388 RepID=UPI0036B6C6B3